MSCTPCEVLDESEAPVRQFLRTAHGVPRVDCASILALCVAKVERVINPPTDKPPTRDPAAGIPGGNASAALGKDEARLAAHDAVVGSALTNMVSPSRSVTSPPTCLLGWCVVRIMVTAARQFGTVGVSIARRKLGNPQQSPKVIFFKALVFGATLAVAVGPIALLIMTTRLGADSVWDSAARLVPPAAT